LTPLMEFSPSELVAVAAIYVLAGSVKGAIGLGLPTVSMGLLGIWLPVEQAAAILILPAFLTNVWQSLAIGITALIATSALALGLGLNGSLEAEVVVPGLIAVVAAFAGMFLGQAVRTKLSVELFRRWVLIALMMLGAAMIIRAF
jgi:uncharacterized membrane protein YfcA